VGNDAEHVFRCFIDAFNREDVDALDDAWTSPFAYASNGEVKTFAKYRDFVNFDGLRATGWARTRIDSLDVLLDDGTTALVSADLCRLASDDTELASGSLSFVLVNGRDGWKLRVGMNFANLPTGR
jgi:ketosteroid isomerase-like protein